MTNLEILLTILLWIIMGIICGKKWTEAVYPTDCSNEFLYFVSIVFMPFVLTVAFIRQTLFEDWK